MELRTLSSLTAITYVPDGTTDIIITDCHYLCSWWNYGHYHQWLPLPMFLMELRTLSSLNAITYVPDGTTDIIINDYHYLRSWWNYGHYHHWLPYRDPACEERKAQCTSVLRSLTSKMSYNWLSLLKSHKKSLFRNYISGYMVPGWVSKTLYFRYHLLLCFFTDTGSKTSSDENCV
jgi:hypothetical protein